MVALVWFASSSLVIQLARAQGRPQAHRAIELSETNSAQILTRLDQLTNKKEAPRQLDDQLRSLRSLISPEDSMEQRFSVPYSAPSLPTRKLKDLLDRNKNWALTPEEVNQVTGGKDADMFPGFTDDKNSSRKSLEQFYETLIQQGSSKDPNKTGDRSDNNRPTLSKKSDDYFSNRTVDDDSSLPPSIREKTEKLKKLVTDDLGGVFSSARPRSSFDNFFGFTEAPDPSPGKDAPGKPHVDSFLDQFKKGMDPSTALGLNPALSALMPNNGSLRTTPVGPDLGKLATPLHKEQPLAIPTLAGTLPNPTALSDMNSTVLNQWNPLYTAPKLELPKPAPPPTPINFEYPRRRF